MPAPRRARNAQQRSAGRSRPERARATGSPVPAPARGIRLTDRDADMLRWVGRHGIVTPQLVAAQFFAREAGDPGQRSAYRRLAKLEELGLVQRDWILFNAPQVIRLTRAGAQLADVGLEPAKLVVAEVPHAIQVVGIAERALASSPRGWELVTERELRAERWRRRGRGETPRGRMPDAVLAGPGGERIAIEVDQTSKRSRDVESIIADYRYGDDQYDRIWWYAPAGRVAARVRAIVEDNQAADLIEVREWRA